MPTDTNRLGDKWARASQDAVPQAIREYNEELSGMADALIAAKARMKTEYAASIDNAAFDDNVRAGFNEAVAGAGYTDSMTQYGENGPTQTQKEKINAYGALTRHLATLVSGVVTAADGGSGNLTFLVGQSDARKRQIIMSALVQLSANFSTSTTVNGAVAVLKANITKIDDLSVS